MRGAMGWGGMVMRTLACNEVGSATAAAAKARMGSFMIWTVWRDGLTRDG